MLTNRYCPIFGNAEAVSYNALLEHRLDIMIIVRLFLPLRQQAYFQIVEHRIWHWQLKDRTLPTALY